MKIEHDSQKVKEFSDIMLSKYYHKSVSQRTGFHRSDAIACPLKAYWRMTGEIVQEYGTRNVGIFLLGELAHIALHRHFDAQEKVYKLQGIHITVDAIFDGKYPIETKSTRKKVYKKEDLLDSWIEQLCIAMAVMEVNVGYLMVLNIITYGLTVWKITMGDTERTMFINSCIWQIISIANAIKEKTPETLTPKHENCNWCGYKPKRGKKGCPYYRKPSK